MIVLKEACLWGWGTKDENINLKWMTSICLQELFVQVHTGAATVQNLAFLVQVYTVYKVDFDARYSQKTVGTRND